MSQSPVEDLSETASLKYKQGWRALNRLLHEDRSFSGHERNCAFLNIGGDTPRFADVSAVTGFDFADDGRGLATVDWDFDGDLDIWTTNRTAPRVRFLRNNTTPSGRFVAFKLTGDGVSCNRDAIGARLELSLSGTDSPLRIRTLHGGEGFLSQSSNWLHFGLKESETIEKAIVRWPGGKPQEFTGIATGQFHKLTQGQAAPIPFNPPPRRIPLSPSEQAPDPPVETARIIVPAGLPMAEITTGMPGENTESHPLSTRKPTLINLWASTCASCLAELGEWSAHREAFARAGVEILTLSTDHLSENGNPAKTRAVLARIGSSFLDKPVSEDCLQSLDDLQRSVLDRWIPLSVPVTFLVSPKGEVVSLYKGPVSTEQLLRDLPLATASPEERRDATLSFPGRWFAPPASADPKRLASMMLDHNRLEAAISYLSRCIDYFGNLETTATPEGKRRLGDLCYMAGILASTDPAAGERALQLLTRARHLIPHDLRIRLELGRLYLDRGRLSEALPEFIAASRINPSDLGLRHDIGVLHLRTGEFATAREYLAPLVEADPGNGLARYELANTEVGLRHFEAAIDGYRKALTAAPKLLDAAYSLAWILSSHPDENLRSPEEALALASQLCKMTREGDPRYLDCLSVALANMGNFDEAIHTATKAMTVYGATDEQASQRIKARIELYKAGTPYRETAWQ